MEGIDIWGKVNKDRVGHALGLLGNRSLIATRPYNNQTCMVRVGTLKQRLPKVSGFKGFLAYAISCSGTIWGEGCYPNKGESSGHKIENKMKTGTIQMLPGIRNSIPSGAPLNS